jgi:hypothetical protein
VGNKPARHESHVFINVPFDLEYEPLFLALLAALVGRGLVPRSVLEIPPSRDRLTRLLNLIEECGLSIHDLSRVTLSTKGLRVPRFNMPFEAGLAVAIARHARHHEWRLLEARPYRLQQSLSDLNGFDPVIHEGRPEGMLNAVANLFPRLDVDEDRVHEVYEKLTHFRRQRIKGELYTPRAFAQLVRAAPLIFATGAAIP